MKRETAEEAKRLLNEIARLKCSIHQFSWREPAQIDQYRLKPPYNEIKDIREAYDAQLAATEQELENLKDE